MKRRKRLEDGSFGELEKVFSFETSEEKIDRLEMENASLTLDLIHKEVKLETIEQMQADMMLLIIGGNK